MEENLSRALRAEGFQMWRGIANSAEVRATFATEPYEAGLLHGQPAQWHLQTFRLQAMGDTGILFDSSDIFIISTYCVNFF